MTASILGDRFLGRREPAWHELGTVFPQDEQLSVVDAVQRAGANFQVVTVPQPPIEAFGRSIDLGNRVAIVRQPLPDDPEPRVLGYATSNYRVIQNSELGSMLQPLGDAWPVETVGVLGAGEQIFITLDAGTTDIKGDPIREFFLITDGKTGGSALKVAFTPVRVVCQNTLVSGLAAASISSSVPHKGDFKGEVKFHVDMMAGMRKAQQQVREAMIALAEKQVSADQVREIFLAAYPDPTKGSRVKMAESLGDNIEQLSQDENIDKGKLEKLLKSTTRYQYYAGRSQVYRDEVTNLYEKLNDEYPSLAGTAWHAWNAVTELSDYRVGSDGVSYSAIFGLRASEKVRGFQAALALV